MKIIREHINEKFIEDSDPISDMGIGLEAQIKKFVKEQGSEYKLEYDLDNALWICAKEGKFEFVKFLLEKGADVHTVQDFALRYASERGHKDIVKLLLQYGADVHINENWPLVGASQKGYKEVVELLLKYGANVHTRNDYALRMASYNGHKEVVELLLKYGADVHARNDSALKWSSHNGHKDVVKVLQDHIAKEKKGVVKESLLEKFTEDSDPIRDMGIGMINFSNNFLELFSKAEHYHYVFTVYIEYNFIDFYFSQPRIRLLDLSKQKSLFRYVTNIISEINFDSILEHPEFFICIDKETKEWIPRRIRYTFDPIYFKKIKLFNYRRDAKETNYHKYSSIDSKESYIDQIKTLTEKQIDISDSY